MKSMRAPLARLLTEQRLNGLYLPESGWIRAPFETAALHWPWH